MIFEKRVCAICNEMQRVPDLGVQALLSNFI